MSKKNRKRMAGDIFKRRKQKKKMRRAEIAAEAASFNKNGRKESLADLREKLGTANPEVTDMIRYADDDQRRSAWTDTYNDDGKIRWSTNSAKGSKERRQERKTMRFLERETGLDFKRTNARSRIGSNIQI